MQVLNMSKREKGLERSLINNEKYTVELTHS